MKKELIKLSMFLIAGLMFACGQPGAKKAENKFKTISQVQAVNTLTPEEKADGWQLLFDGKSFKGWRGIGIKGIPEGHWEIVDGAIHKIGKDKVPRQADGQPVKGGDLITDDTFNDFILTFEWKIGKGANSGVKYNVIEEYSIKNGSTRALGYEYQVIDDVNNKDIAHPDQTAASLYALIPAKHKKFKPVGEYNTAKIVFIKNHGEHWLNGKKVVDYDINTSEFQMLFEKSKYHTHKDFTKHKIAHIVLQDHGDDCWFRNIKIKRLD